MQVSGDSSTPSPGGPEGRERSTSRSSPSLVVDGETVGRRHLPRRHRAQAAAAILRVAPRAEPRGHRHHRSRRQDVLEPGRRAAVRLHGRGGHRPQPRRSRGPTAGPASRGRQLNRGGAWGPRWPGHPADAQGRIARRRRDRGRAGRSRRRARRLARHLPRHQRAQQQKRYYESLLEISPSAIVIVDLEDRINSWNPAAERLFGYTAEEAIGRNLDDLVAPRDELREEAMRYSEAAAGGEQVRSITRRTRKDGSLVDVEVVSAPVVVGRASAVGYFVIYSDIGELQRQRRYYEAVLKLSPTAIVTIDQDQRHVVEPAAERLFGYTAEEAVGRNIDDLVAHDAELRRRRRGTALQGSAAKRSASSLVEPARTARSSTSRSRRRRSSSAGSGSALRDLPRHQRAPAAEALLRGTVRVEPDGDRADGSGGDVTAWNPAAERLFGYTAEEAIGRTSTTSSRRTPEIRAEARAPDRASG